MANRAIMTIPPFQSYEATNPPKWDELKNYFDEEKIEKFDTWKYSTAQERAEEIINKLSEIKSNDVSIYTYSGGGMALRYAISKLEVENKQLYNKIKKIVVRDSPMEGVAYPVSFLMLYILFVNEGKSLEDTLNDPPEKNGIDMLHLSQTRQMLHYWPHWNTEWRKQEKVIKKIKVSMHPDREQFLKELSDFGALNKWGKGITKVSIINGGNKLFNPTTFDATKEEEKEYLLLSKHSKYPKNAYVKFNLLSEREMPKGQSYRTPENVVLDIDFYETAIPSTSIKKIKLTQDDRDGVFDGGIAPGSIYYLESWMELFLEQLTSKGFKNKLYYPNICHIPTLSAASITGQASDWAAGKNKHQLQEKSNFERIYFDEENKDHGDTWAQGDLVEELKTSD